MLSAVEREGGWAPLSSHVTPHVARSQQDGGSLVVLDKKKKRKMLRIFFFIRKL